MTGKCPVRQKLVKARIQMLMNMPFFGTLAVHLKLKEVDSEEFCPTAGTDGRTFYYNREFIEKLDEEELKFLFAHEVMHCCYDHMGRRGSREANVYNIASDHVINLEITDQNVGKLISRPDDENPIIPCHDSKYRDMSSDEIYEILIEEQEQSGESMQHSFDVHFDSSDMTDEEAEAAGIDRLSEEERQMIRDAFRQATIEAAKTAGMENVPAGIREMMDDLLDPQMDWRECLNANIQTLVKSDWTYSRPNRRNSSLGGIILPGNDVDEAVSVCCAIDTSGSISHEMIREFLSEIKGIMEQFAQFKIKVWCFDTSTYTVWEWNEDNSDEMDEFYPEGGGGTDFMVNWVMMKEEEIEPDQFVMFTDGYPWDSWGDESYQDNMVFLISGDPQQKITAPFGTTLHYDS